MSNSIYRQSLHHAWLLTWRHKTLWIFGLLSVFLGQLGLGDFAGALWRQIQGQPMNDWTTWFSAPDIKSAIAIVWIGGILLGFGVLLLIAAVTSQGALIFAACEWYKKNKISNTTALWGKGLKNFGPLLAINILRKLLLTLLIFFCGLLCLKIADTSLSYRNPLIIAIMIVELLAALTISAVSIYASGYIVADKKNLLAAIKKGWSLFSRHIVVSLELNIILLLIGALIILILLAGSAVLLLPSLIIYIVAGLTGYTTLMIVGLALGWLLFIIAIALIGGIFNAFSTNAWMYLFMKMHHEGIASRVAHYFKKIFRLGV